MSERAIYYFVLLKMIVWFIVIFIQLNLLQYQQLEFMEGWYNNTRIHSSLDYKTPNQKYNEYIKGVA